MSLLALLSAALPLHAQNALERLREDVSGTGSGSVAEAPPSRADDPKDRGDHSLTDDWLNEGLVDLWFIPAGIVTSPFWFPHLALGDDFGVARFFARFPYEFGDGYLAVGLPSDWRSVEGSATPSSSRGWAGRLQCDWGGDFDDLQRIDGHLLVSTASRFEWDTQFDYLREASPGGQHDELWLGDGNLVFRFAQNEQMLFRAGLGFNWLADAGESDFGVNLTYGVDWFPRRPWVLSSELDWGTLGSAELFRFRGTVGATIHGVEVFTGYEYLDIDRFHQNAFLSGVRVWF